MRVRTSSYSSDAVHWLGDDHGLGVVVRLRVGLGEWVGYSDADDPGPVSALEGVRAKY